MLERVANQLRKSDAPLAGSATGTLQENAIRLNHHSFHC
jgi:hypothetical protein